MFQWFKKVMAWELIFEAGANRYFENTITGERRVVRGRGGYSPVDTSWLTRTKIPLGSPPTGGSGVMK